jgi:hypothetical protein
VKALSLTLLLFRGNVTAKGQSSKSGHIKPQDTRKQDTKATANGAAIHFLSNW